MANYVDDFKKEYQQPRINRVTVGFSGIDPQQKTEQQVLIKEMIDAYFSSLSIHIDSGNVDPNAQEPAASTVVMSPTEIPHENLAGLLGGNSSGHYHLTQEEHENLNKYPAYESLAGEIAGDLAGEVEHNALKGIQGGLNGEYYHLTEEQLTKLIILANTFIPEESSEVVVPEDDHEKLKSILGGAANDHYHLTGFELYKLQQIIELLFPNGATAPVLPSSGSGGSGSGSGGGSGSGSDSGSGSGSDSGSSGSGSDSGSGGEETPGSSDGEIIYAGLPHVAPPEWVRNECPKISNSVYAPFSGVHRMYYGKTGSDSKTESTNIGLHVLMDKGNSQYLYLLYTEDLVKWKMREDIQKPLVQDGIAQYLYSDTKVSTYLRHRLYLFFNGANEKYPPMRYLQATNGMTTLSTMLTSKTADKATTPYIAGADSGNNLIIFVAKEGKVARVIDKKVQKSTTVYHCGLEVNPGCAAWSPKAQRFCVSGPNGTAVSSDGATWQTYTNAPKNLEYLTYRADIDDGVFFALSAGEKVFYASVDGMTWAKYNTAEIPLATIAAVDYNPDLGWYCAVGGTSKYAYFSKNLKNWIATKVTDVAIDMGSVIWMPSTQKYVLMPKSGVSYYTFKPSDWSDA